MGLIYIYTPTNFTERVLFFKILVCIVKLGDVRTLLFLVTLI